jgi:ribonucleotide monophosphatase NagD (HAD superfamily)
MRKLIRLFAAVVYIALLAVSGIVVSTGTAMTEDQVASPVKQIVLTKKQIEGVLAAQKEMDEINEKLSEKARPYLIVAEQLEGVAKKNGFATYDEYTDVVDNISIVIAGLDPVTKKYIGSEAVIRAQIARIQADKNTPAENKTEALAELNNALKSPAPPVENKGNIDLVATYYDKFADMMGSDQQ